jgi:N-acetylglucosaminyldiphosphoundecaprenol N-acetyl-beta-D-mannosaminyltransferase
MAVTRAAQAMDGHPADWLNLLGVRISAVDIPAAVALIEAAIARGLRGYVCIRDVHGIVKCQSDAELKQVHNQAYLVTPDGMPVVWALKLAGKRAHRVYGPDLMLALLDNGRRTGMRHFFYGTTPEVLERLVARLEERYPGVEIVGTLAPPFRELTPAEEDGVAAQINATLADVVWVGLGTPKQELWMSRVRDRLTAPILVGVGAAFDFHAGVKRQAPRLVQRSGFEWLFRLACEPRRLARRYAVAVPSFLGLSAAQMLGLRDFPMNDEDGRPASR